MTTEDLISILLKRKKMIKANFRSDDTDELLGRLNEITAIIDFIIDSNSDTEDFTNVLDY